MSNDHYVAQTYLRHFVDSNEMLHVYPKDGSYPKRRGPKGICHEWDGDLIPDFLQDDRFLGKYRAMFEQPWSDAVSDIGNGIMNPIVKMAIAGYWANLMVCTPAWTRIAVKMHTHGVLHRMRAEDILRTRSGKPDAKIKRLVAALDSGQIAMETEPDAMRARSAALLTQFAWALYNAEWTVLRNRTATPFLTSDNPVAFADPGPWSPTRAPGLPKFLPLTPELCLYGFMDPRRGEDEPDFTKPPRGKVEWASIRVEGVKRINRSVAQCAEDSVISSQHDDAVQRLVAECARYRVDVEFVELDHMDGLILGNVVRVCEAEAVASQS